MNEIFYNYSLDKMALIKIMEIKTELIIIKC